MFVSFFSSILNYENFCSGSIALSEQENILSDVLPKNQSVASVEESKEKQEEAKLNENSKISKKQLNNEKEIKKAPVKRKSIAKNMVLFNFFCIAYFTK